MNFVEDLSSNLSTIRSGELKYVFFDTSETPLLNLIMKSFITFHYCPWIFSLIGSLLVGLSGIFPLLVINVEDGENLNFGAGANRLRVLLSFAVGGLLGDVFLHLLPEAWENKPKSDLHSHPSFFSGVWVLTGMLIFIIVEKLSSTMGSEVLMKNDEKVVCSIQAEDKKGRRGFFRRQKNSRSFINNNDNENLKCSLEDKNLKHQQQQQHHISGYLNLLANFVDNFTHGMAIGGSFSISFKMGIFSTFAILVHELPHEIGDFAILLKSGFSRWDAAKAQIFTAFSGIIGSMLAVVYGSSDSLESKTSWILPFTAGGFLHIALVTVLPDLVNEESTLESCKQLGSLVLGIGIMAFLITFFG